MIDWSTCVAVERDPERVSGAWLFRGTRVPVAAVFENLEDDVTIHAFVELFRALPSTRRAPSSSTRRAAPLLLRSCASFSIKALRLRSDTS